MGYIVFAIVVIILAVVLQPKPPVPAPPSLSELEVPTAKQGKAIPKVFGQKIVTSPNIVWYGDLAYNKVTSKGGK
jgi:hypothetical protein